MRVAIIGATGYGGLELIRLLLGHPHFTIQTLVSSTKAGESLGELIPHLSHLTVTLEQLDVDQLCEQNDCIFFATPPGVSSKWAPLFVEREKVIVDLSGDFRLHHQELYETWYQKTSAPQRWLDQAVYGLSEWYRDKIKTASLISNPGCYPTATLLALAPLLEQGWISTDHPLIIDAKSGVTGAGKNVNTAMIFSEVNENLRPYKVNQHQHIPEIEQYSTQLADQTVQVNFTPHLVPMNRGLLVTIYTELLHDYTDSDIQQLFTDTYENEPFVRVMKQGFPQTKQVQGSNYCDIGFHVDPRTGRLILLAAIDNLVKGAAGQAIQNANLRMGFPETSGLTLSPVAP